MFNFPQNIVILNIFFFYIICANKLNSQLFRHFVSLNDLVNEHKIIN